MCVVTVKNVCRSSHGSQEDIFLLGLIKGNQGPEGFSKTKGFISRMDFFRSTLLECCQPQLMILEKKHGSICKYQSDGTEHLPEYYWVAFGFCGLTKIHSKERVQLTRVIYNYDVPITEFGKRLFRSF